MQRAVAPFIILVVAVVSATAQSGPQKPFTIDDLINIRRVADPQLSPDDRWVACAVRDESVSRKGTR